MTTAPILEARNLQFRYRRNSEELLGGLNHVFPVGTVTAITGPSGRGKSTLLYVLGLLLKPSQGGVLVNGVPVHMLPDANRSALRAKQFGFVFQDASLDPNRRILDSVVEPARYAGVSEDRATSHARFLLSTMGVGLRADHKPGEISGGQAQRVAVCRALVNDPSVILADEPTGNLDQENASSVLDALCSAVAGSRRTVIIATHDPYVLTRVDEVVSL